MKNLLLILMLLVTATGSAATYQNYFTTNSGSVALMSYGPAQAMAAVITTNNIEDRSRIFVTGNGSALVNGEYKVRFYDATNFLGVWTNTLSTNKIIMNNVSNNGNFASQPFIISGQYETTDQLMYQQDQNFLGPRGSWINPFSSVGMTAFAGTATLKWATNYGRTFALVPYNVGVAQAGLAGTNVLRVSEFGDDSLASRLNGYPFHTLFCAYTNAQYGDVIYMDVGHYLTQPFHMQTRGIHIIGSGPGTVVEVDHFDDQAGQAFQSDAIVPWDNCSIGNFTLTNGLIALAQFTPTATEYGGTNIWVHDLTIYPPKQLKYPPNNPNIGNGDQPEYFNKGVRIGRIGNNNTLERIKVYSGLGGFIFGTSLRSGNTINMIDCEAYCRPEYAFNGSPSTWTNMTFLLATNVGGMIPIGFENLRQADMPYTFTLNIIGGNFSSFNGGTNVGAYVGGEIQSNRNAGFWFSKGYTNTVTVNISGVPQFFHGTSNGVSYAVLNESTNSSLVLNGYYYPKAITQPTNQTSQSVYAGGGAATSTSSMATMNFVGTDPTMTVTSSGYYMILASGNGYTSSSDNGEQVVFELAINGTAIANSQIAYLAEDGGLSGFLFKWYLSMPPVFASLTAGQTLALRWQGSGGGTAYVAENASVSILRLR